MNRRKNDQEVYIKILLGLFLIFYGALIAWGLASPSIATSPTVPTAHPSPTYPL